MKVLDSRPVEDGNSIKRRRECSGCGKRYTTYEVIDSVPITVVKKDGAKEFFDRHKLHSGILKACQKRPVDTEAIVNQIEAELSNSLVGEVSTTDIGNMVMDKLKSVDAVSYVRFASVYREFKDVDTFLEELKLVIKDAGKSKK
jgi:transcriptional repressor NrdR